MSAQCLNFEIQFCRQKLSSAKLLLIAKIVIVSKLQKSGINYILIKK
ncbi:hypothetical protein A1OE_760 [Candidatus Endolissoclinum faulkneri L2]|uniref:Uncharacterized protein n=1 Tax=Candidatus Endolissoclinum faulkneri L2 TaxID=1193729 RepID=K7ZCW6_9PROT|nr:hypothetical protein A1OE_760 [Candidatus Endolissoclinum faulkneri L2]